MRLFQFLSAAPEEDPAVFFLLGLFFVLLGLVPWFGWSVGQSVGWLVVGCLVGRSVGWLVGRIPGITSRTGPGPPIGSDVMAVGWGLL